MREAERKLAALQRQADANAEGLRALTGGSFKRLDEHASAIQRLTLVSATLDMSNATFWGLHP